MKQSYEEMKNTICGSSAFRRGWAPNDRSHNYSPVHFSGSYCMSGFDVGHEHGIGRTVSGSAHEIAVESICLPSLRKYERTARGPVQFRGHPSNCMCSAVPHRQIDIVVHSKSRLLECKSSKACGSGHR